ncbi:MAG TPA: MarR family winged helix-turn-helix transcriptional regulator [Vicinamibacterales bacterium]|nr:MarR family winged helix-turn-helix transcriptional regulator [Vicinamibacterales bacterium]
MPHVSAIRCVQTCYPQIYLACHVDHKRGRTSSTGLSSRDSSILAHLDEQVPVTAGALARHLGIGAPALSAILKRLATRGYIVQAADPADRRRQQVRLTAAGAVAMSKSSVLEPRRVQALLRRLTPQEREHALQGLALFARAARECMAGRRS